MNEEHLQLEAEWLATELKRCLDHIEQANASNDHAQRDMFYAGIEQIVHTLYNHYRTDAELTNDDSRDEPLRYYPSRPKQRGKLGRILLGDK